VTERFVITGGAGPQETAAIAAAVAQALIEEEGLLALPVARPEQSTWVLAGRPREVPLPLPSPEHQEPVWESLE
jgi:hypothetical protein